MIRRTQIVGAVAALGAASLVLAACGGSGSSGESSSAAPASSTAAPSSSSAEPSPSSDCKNPDALKVGTLLPATGQLAYLGPPEFAGVDLAVGEIDAAGGVFGAPIVSEYGDSGDTTTDIASQTIDSHLSKGMQVIIGAASSGVTLSVIDKVSQNGLVMISPANTAPALTTYPDNGLYFRTAPSDALQGAIQASLAADAGFTKGATIARDDAYGLGLQAAFETDFVGAGGEIGASLKYAPEATSFEAEVAEIKAADPEFVQVVGFEESTKLLQEMIKQGVGPQDVQIYLADGNASVEAFADFPKGEMTGTVATFPTGDPSVDLDAFNERLLGQDPSLKEYLYGAQAYDAVVLAAIAAEYAKCGDGTAIAAAMSTIANEGGEACATFAECKTVIDAGGTPNYNGVTGPLDFNEFGDPAAATISVVQYDSNTSYEEIEVVGPVTVPVPVG